MVTEATLKLTGIPVVHLAATVTFETLEAASQTVAVLMGSGLEPAALELLTPELIALMNREKSLGIEEKPSLFCEFHGISEAALKETADLAEELCRDGGAVTFKTGVTEKERRELWRGAPRGLGDHSTGPFPEGRPLSWMPRYPSPTILKWLSSPNGNWMRKKLWVLYSATPETATCMW